MELIIILIGIIGMACLCLILGVGFALIQKRNLEEQKKIAELQMRAASASTPNVFKTPAEADKYLIDLISVVYKQIVERETAMSSASYETYITNVKEFTQEISTEILLSIPDNIRDNFLEYYTMQYFTNTIARCCKTLVLVGLKKGIYKLTNRMEYKKEEDE